MPSPNKSSEGVVYAFFDSVATPFLEECEDDIHTPEMGIESPPGLLKLQSSIARVKTPRLEALFISFQSYQSVDIKNGLA